MNTEYVDGPRYANKSQWRASGTCVSSGYYQTEMIVKLDVIDRPLSPLDSGNAVPGKLP